MKGQSVLFIKEENQISSSESIPIEVLEQLRSNFTLNDVKSKLAKNLISNDISCFVGIYSSNDLLVIGYPKYMKYDLHMKYFDNTTPLSYKAKELMKQMKIICKCIERVDRQKGIVLNDFLSKKKENSNISKLYLAERIIRDYNEHGIISEQIEEDTFGQGRTDWRKTIKRQQPVFISNKPIYLKTIQTYNYDDENGSISQIHMRAIKELLSLFGIMLGYNNYVVSREEYNGSSWANADNMHIVQYLERWLRNSFSDRVVNLIHMLIAWFKDGMDVLNNNDFYGTASFRSVFEGMCQDMFLDDKTWTKYMPSVTYRIYTKSGINNIPLSDVLQPDLSYDMITERKYLIFDAKYYTPNIVSGKGFPAISDVNKQKSYLKYIRDGINDESIEIYNVFLLPQFIDEPLEWFENLASYIGDVFLPDEISEIKEKNKSECVDLIQLDMLHFTTDYASGNDIFNREKYRRFISYLGKMKEKVIKEEEINIAEKFLDLLENKTISIKTELSVEEVAK